jgi:peptide/nickel transport system substrate-binding protein
VSDSGSWIDGSELSRRELLERGAAAGLALGLSGWLAESAGAAVRATPKRGGTFRVALVGGSASSEQLDPHSNTVSDLDVSRFENVYSKLTDLNAKGSYEMQLAQSMEPNAKADVWQVKLKRGVQWHDGSELTADDVIYSYTRILDPANKLASAAPNISMIDPKRLKKIDKYTVEIGLKQPWSDLPAQVGQRYCSIIKNGTSSFTVDNSNGTGPFKLTAWTPGDSYDLAANSNYFESGKPYVSTVKVISITDPTARVNALISGQVDASESVPAAQVQVLKGRGLQPLIAQGGGWTPLYMNTRTAPFTDVRVRQAMKLLIDRKKVLAASLQGYGSIGNDLFARWDPLYDKGIPQRQYDPEKALALLKAAGQDKTRFTLYTSDAVADMVPTALVFAQNAKAAGVSVTVSKQPADSYWTSTYGKKPFAFSAWGYRPFLAQWLQSYSVFNKDETFWANAAARKANSIVRQLAATADPGKRRELAHEAQRIEWDDGGYVIPYFVGKIDGLAKNVHGIIPHIFTSLGWYHFKDAWLA